MDNSTLSTILWILAGLILVVYLARRRKRRTLR
jgi:MYXO-CTERM domain-containing protein